MEVYGKFAEANIPIGLAMSPPAVRMVVVVAWWHESGGGHEVHPVLALVGTQGHEFSRPAEGRRDFPVCPGPAEMRRLGWTYDGPGWVDFDVLVLDEDHGLAPARRAFSGSNAVYEVVAVDWARHEDPERLAPVVARLIEKARAKDAAASRLLATTPLGVTG